MTHIIFSPFRRSTQPGTGGSGETCTQRSTPLENALGAWAPQYWADTMGMSFKYFNADIHKILDFQTMEYGYASDLGLSIDTDLLDSISMPPTRLEDMAENVLGEFSASVSSNVGWKGRNRGNWKNLRDGYTGDAFGIGASLPLKPLDAGVFSIDGGVTNVAVLEPILRQPNAKFKGVWFL